MYTSVFGYAVGSPDVDVSFCRSFEYDLWFLVQTWKEAQGKRNVATHMRGPGGRASQRPCVPRISSSWGSTTETDVVGLVPLVALKLLIECTYKTFKKNL